jgi:hypothetical protein
LVFLLLCISLFACCLLLSFFLFHLPLYTFFHSLCLARFYNLFLYPFLWLFPYFFNPFVFLILSSLVNSALQFRISLCHSLHVTFLPLSSIFHRYSIQPVHKSPKITTRLATGTNADCQHGVRRVSTVTMLTPSKQNRVPNYVTFLSTHHYSHGQVTAQPNDFPHLKPHTQTQQR